jgi:ADP-heptose:LPS heptosyltransferase
MNGLMRIWKPRQFPLRVPSAFYVLMVRPLGVGDIMMLSPFLEALSRRYTSIPVWLVTEYQPFLSSHIRWIHPRNLQKKDLRKSILISPTLSWRHIKWIPYADQYIGYFFSSRLFGNIANAETSYCPESEHYYDRVKPISRSLGLNPDEIHYPEIIEKKPTHYLLPCDYVCVSPFSNWAERQYPIDDYKKIILELSKFVPVVIVGGNSRQELDAAKDLIQENFENHGINMVGKTTFSEVAYIIKRSKLYIGNDSGLSHVAFLSQVPSIAIFGCVPSRLRVPLAPPLREQILEFGAGDSCPFFPCYDGFNKPHCKNREKYICLQKISAQEVINAAMRLLSHSQMYAVNGASSQDAI